MANRPKTRPRHIGIILRILLGTAALALAWQLILAAPKLAGRVAVADWGTVENGTRIDALLVRYERVFRADARVRLFMVAIEGQRVARGELIAFTAGPGLSEEQCSRVAVFCETVRKSESDLTEKVRGAEDGLARAGAMEAEARQLFERLPADAGAFRVNEARTRWEQASHGREEAERRLGDLVSGLEGMRAAHQRNLDKLLSETPGHLRPIYAVEAALASSMLDGMEERITPASIVEAGEILVPRKVEPRQVLAGEWLRPGDAMFRLVDNYRLLLVAKLGKAWMSNISQPGQTVWVAFGEEEPDAARVVRIEGQFAVLQMDRFAPECLTGRTISAHIIWRRQSGVRIPRSAVAVKDGRTGVTTIRGSQRQFRPVTVLAEGRRYAIVEGLEPGTLVRW